jgi:type IV pilus assembly protein PilB
MTSQSKTQLGELLVEHGLVTRAKLDEALQRQRSSYRFLGEILVEMGAITRRDLTRILQLQHKLSQDEGRA